VPAALLMPGPTVTRLSSVPWPRKCDDFKTLVSDVAMGQVGAIFSLESSRLARSNKDWHRLLELCAVSGHSRRLAAPARQQTTDFVAKVGVVERGSHGRCGLSMGTIEDLSLER
jgi:hypothetical protein